MDGTKGLEVEDGRAEDITEWTVWEKICETLRTKYPMKIRVGPAQILKERIYGNHYIFQRDYLDSWKEPASTNQR